MCLETFLISSLGVVGRRYSLAMSCNMTIPFGFHSVFHELTSQSPVKFAGEYRQTVYVSYKEQKIKKKKCMNEKVKCFTQSMHFYFVFIPVLELFPGFHRNLN